MKPRHWSPSIPAVASLVGILAVLACNTSAEPPKNPDIGTKAVEQASPPSPEPLIAIYSPGTSSCGTWTAARRAEGRGNAYDIRAHQFVAFLHGYATAYNVYRDNGATKRDVLAASDAEGSKAFIDNYCAGNPTAIFQAAVVALLNDLEAK